MKWKEILKDVLFKNQGGKCVDCNGELGSQYRQDYYAHVIRRKDHPAVLVHRNCAKVDATELKALQAQFLKKKNVPISTIAKTLGVSERQVWRYLRIAATLFPFTIR